MLFFYIKCCFLWKAGFAWKDIFQYYTGWSGLHVKRICWKILKFPSFAVTGKGEFQDKHEVGENRKNYECRGRACYNKYRASEMNQTLMPLLQPPAGIPIRWGGMWLGTVFYRRHIYPQGCGKIAGTGTAGKASVRRVGSQYLRWGVSADRGRTESFLWWIGKRAVQQRVYGVNSLSPEMRLYAPWGFVNWFSCISRRKFIPTNEINCRLHSITSERIGNPELKAAIKCVHEYKSPLRYHSIILSPQNQNFPFLNHNNISPSLP